MTDRLARPIGIGCMRLSTSEDAAEERAIATITAALEGGATLLDTAGAYGLSEHDAHGNERWIARALAAYGGDRASITVVTKGGLVRAGERYAIDGRATALRAACDASCEALGVASLDVFLLHAVDPKTSLETSVRALDGLRRAGTARRIGLSNVSLAELDRARAITEIDAVEVALSPWDDAPIRGGLVGRCVDRGIQLLAHSPLGGPRRASKLASDPVLDAIARRHGSTAAQIVIAWLRDLAPAIVPIPGVGSARHAREMIAACQLALTDADRDELDARWSAGAQLRGTRDDRGPAADAKGDVVVVMGMQGSGKTTLARDLGENGYARLNRDSIGGTLRGLVPRLDRELAAGRRSIVLDNTYASRAARNEVIEAAWKHGVPARCVWIDAPIEVAQANVARRMLEAHGRLLEPGEIDAAAKKDPSIVPPRALFRFRRELEPPSAEEGFRTIEVLPFARRPREGFDREGLLVALDAIASRPPAGDVLVLDLARIAVLLARPERICAYGWLPASTPDERSRIDAAVARARAELGPIDIAVCAHPGGPPVCWCRPPLPGLAVAMIEAHRLDPARTTIAGTGPHHRALSEATGAQYVDAAQLFGD